jgi:hypothetical protein
MGPFRAPGLLFRRSSTFFSPPNASSVAGRRLNRLELKHQALDALWRETGVMETHGTALVMSPELRQRLGDELILEIVDPESGSPVAPGQLGVVISRGEASPFSNPGKRRIHFNE